MTESKRVINYTEAICEATRIAMKEDPSVILMGLGVDDERGLQGTTRGLVTEFGADRVFDTPIAEDGMTGVAIGMAQAGLKPIHNHARMDFLLLAMNQLINVASKHSYMYGGQTSIPLVVRALIGKGWGAQHSQALHSCLAQFPGLKIVAPSNPYDAKGLLLSAIRDPNPVVYVEHFSLYSTECVVPENDYMLPIGKSSIVRSGQDITIVAMSYMVEIALRVAEELFLIGINAEVVDIRTVSPLDSMPIISSAIKTSRVLILDIGWTFSGISAEIVALIHESNNSQRKIYTKRIGLPHLPCPTSKILEDVYYPSIDLIKKEAQILISNIC